MARIQRFLTAAAAVLWLSLCSGCMSLEHLVDPDTELEMYGGTRASAEYIADESTPLFGTLFRVIDLPFTVVMDTLVLPVSAPVELSRGDD